MAKNCEDHQVEDLLNKPLANPSCDSGSVSEFEA